MKLELLVSTLDLFLFLTGASRSAELLSLSYTIFFSPPDKNSQLIFSSNLRSFVAVSDVKRPIFFAFCFPLSSRRCYTRDPNSISLWGYFLNPFTSV